MSKMRLLKLGVPAVAVIAVMLAGYFYSELRILKQNPQAQLQSEIADLVEKVGKLAVLPAGEDPTIATVEDPSALADQPFFKNAKTGDKVLIYTQAKKAILYSVELNKIVEVAPLDIGATR
jgi:hypothetical protein